MKKTMFTLTFMAIGTVLVSAQTTRKDEMLKNRKDFSDRTLFQRFESEIVPKANERKLKREQNEAKRKLLLTIIDTSQIKLELKKKLRQDVVHNPFSNRLKKFMEKYDLKALVSGD